MANCICNIDGVVVDSKRNHNIFLESLRDNIEDGVPIWPPVKSVNLLDLVVLKENGNIDVLSKCKAYNLKGLTDENKKKILALKDNPAVDEKASYEITSANGAENGANFTFIEFLNLGASYKNDKGASISIVDPVATSIASKSDLKNVLEELSTVLTNNAKIQRLYNRRLGEQRKIYVVTEVTKAKGYTVSSSKKKQADVNVTFQGQGGAVNFQRTEDAAFGAEDHAIVSMKALRFDVSRDGTLINSKPIFDYSDKIDKEDDVSNRKVIDAFCIVQQPPNPLYEIVSKPTCLKALDDMNRFYEPRDFDLQNKHVILAQGFHKEKMMEERGYEQSKIRVLVWCAEGVDEIQRHEETSETTEIIKFIKERAANIDVILLCFRYGVQFTAEKVLRPFKIPIICIEKDLFTTDFGTDMQNTVFQSLHQLWSHGLENIKKRLREKNVPCTAVLNKSSPASKCKCNSSQYKHDSRRNDHNEEEEIEVLGTSLPFDWISNEDVLGDLNLNSMSFRLKDFSENLERLTTTLRRNNNTRAIACVTSGNETDMKVANALCIFFCNHIAAERKRVKFHYFSNFHEAKEKVEEMQKNVNVSTKDVLFWFDNCEGSFSNLSQDEIEGLQSHIKSLKRKCNTIICLLSGKNEQTKHLAGEEDSSFLDKTILGFKDYEFVETTLASNDDTTFKYSDVRGSVVIQNVDNREVSKEDRVRTLETVREVILATMIKDYDHDSSKNKKLLNLLSTYHNTSSELAVSINFMDYQQLKCLLHNLVFDDGRKKLENKLTITMPNAAADNNSSSIKIDLPKVISMYDSISLKFNQLSKEQEDIVNKCQNEVAVDVRGPAGSGKTFIGLKLMFDRVVRFENSTKSINKDVKLLFVCETKELAFHLARWINERLGDRKLFEECLQTITFLPVGAINTSSDHYNHTSYYGMRIKVGNDDMLEEEVLQGDIALSQPYDLIVIDEAHDVLYDAQKFKVVEKILRNNGLMEERTLFPTFGSLIPQTDNRQKKGLLRLAMLSDAAQSRQLNYLDSMPVIKHSKTLKLKEVNRCSQTIFLAAMRYQLGKVEDLTSLTCAHDCIGAKIQPYIFEPKSSIEETWEQYVHYIIKAMKDLLASFGNMDFHNSLAVLVDDEAMREELVNRLSEEKDGKKMLKKEFLQQLGINYEVCILSALESTIRIKKCKKSSSEPSYIILDTVLSMGGMEAIFVIGVGLDKEIINDMHKRQETQSKIFKAITRAHLKYDTIDKEVKGGWYEWLLKIDGDEEFSGFVNEKRKIGSADDRVKEELIAEQEERYYDDSSNTLTSPDIFGQEMATEGEDSSNLDLIVMGEESLQATATQDIISTDLIFDSVNQSSSSNQQDIFRTIRSSIFATNKGNVKRSEDFNPVFAPEKEGESEMEESETEDEDAEQDTLPFLRYKLLLSHRYHPEYGHEEIFPEDLHLVNSLLAFEKNAISNYEIATLIIEALFDRDFKEDGYHWEIDSGFARDLEDDEGGGGDLEGSAFVVQRQARLDWNDQYSVAAARGTITISSDKDEIRIENYSYSVAG